MVVQFLVQLPVCVHRIPGKHLSIFNFTLLVMCTIQNPCCSGTTCQLQLIFFCCAIASLSVIYYIYAHAYVYEPCFLLLQIYLCTMLVCYIICCHYVNFVPMVYVFLFYLNPNSCYFFLNTAV